MTPLELLGLIGVFAIARIAIALRRPATGDRSSGIAIAREYLDAFIAAGLVALFLVTFVIRTFYIPSISMVPTLQVHDVLLISELDYRLHGPRDGDVAVFRPPVNAGGEPYIKRVMGVPGDRISITDGVVYRNGVALNEPYENQTPDYDLKIEHYGIYVGDGDGPLRPLDPHAADIPPQRMWQAPDRVPDGFYFMLGDNRRYSDDSHVWGFAQLHGTFVAGPRAAAHAQAGFIGRAFLIFWPLSRLRIIR